MSERYFESAPTEGLMDISLSLRMIRTGVRRWPRLFRASSERPLMRAASPTTTAIRSMPCRTSRAVARPAGDREARPGVAPVEHVVLRLASPREAADPTQLAERPELRVAAGEELVRVGLVAGVPDDPVAGRFEDPVQRQRDLHDAERRSEMSARHGHRGDDGPPDLFGQLLELGLAEAAKVCRALKAGEDRHVLAP